MTDENGTSLGAASGVACLPSSGSTRLSTGRRDACARARDGAKRERAATCIEALLHRPDLSVAMVAAASGLSRSALYRLFQPRGGVACYIRERRLRALHGVMSEPGEGRPFKTLAYECGLVHPSSACRGFKTLFGMSPGAFRKTHARREADGATLRGS